MSQRFFDSFLYDLHQEVKKGEIEDLMQTTSRVLREDIPGVSMATMGRSKQDVEEEEQPPNVSIMKLLHAAKQKGRAKRRVWVKKSEIRDAAKSLGIEMSDDVFEKYWKKNRSRYLRGRHLEFSTDPHSDEEVVSPGKRGLRRPSADEDCDCSVTDLLKRLNEETSDSDENYDRELFEMTFRHGNGDPWFANEQVMMNEERQKKSE